MYSSATAALYSQMYSFGYLVLLDICLYKLFGLLSKLLASLMRNYFPKRPSGAPLHTLSKLYDVPVGFVPPPPYFEAEYCLFCGRRRVAVARYRMICLVLLCCDGTYCKVESYFLYYNFRYSPSNEGSTRTTRSRTLTVPTWLWKIMA